MGIELNDLTTGLETSAGATSDTASIAPTANSLVLLLVMDEDAGGGGAPAAMTASGGGMTTWDSVITIPLSSYYRSTIFRAQQAVPTSAVITITGDADVDYRYWSVVEYNNVPIGNNGADAIVQSVSAAASASPTNATLASFAATANRAYAAFNGGSALGKLTMDANYTGINESLDAGYGVQDGWLDNDTPDLTPSATGSLGPEIMILAIEMKEEDQAPATVTFGGMIG